jgi:hypothetical protein
MRVPERKTEDHGLSQERSPGHVLHKNVLVRIIENDDPGELYPPVSERSWG